MSIPVVLSTSINNEKDTEGLISLYTGLVGLAQQQPCSIIIDLRDQIKETLANQFPQNFDEIQSEVDKVASHTLKLADEFKDFSLED